MSAKATAPERFQDALHQILESRNLSVTQLSALLGYKSKTTLLRVLQGNVGIRCIGNVYKDICQCCALKLTDVEADGLRVAYEVELWGLDNYRARSEMWRLLYKAQPEQTPMVLLCSDGQSITLNDLYSRFADAALVDVLLLSGCYANVMETMASLLEKLKERIHVMQLFMINNDTARTVRLIRNIMPALGYCNYDAYYLPQNSIVPDPVYSGSGTGKAMVVRVTQQDGHVQEYQILMQSDRHGMLLEGNGIWKHWEQYILSYRNDIVSLKSTAPQVRDYVHLLENYAELERNREILIYKEDVSFALIPTDILLHALSDTLSEIPEAAEQMLSILPKLRSLQEKRYQNMLTKRQNTCWVASAEALYRFAQTGMQNDHFFAMRPFTVEERLRIFRSLLLLVRENPYFHLYLLKSEEENAFVPMEAIYLEGVGFQLTSNGTDYCLENGWTETLLTEQSFCSLYREFFLEELVAHHTRPVEDSEAVLETIISRLQADRKAEKNG